MHEKDFSIITRSNLQTDAVVVNQCNTDSVEEFSFENKKGQKCHVKYINSSERGLSRSRNLAIANSWGDICYICDDDEYLHDEFESIILNAYKLYKDMDIITFAIERKNYTYPTKIRKIGVKEILRTSSVQVTFKRESIQNNLLLFDTLMGSGSGNGGGEENKFLMDCMHKRLKMIYMPEVIAKVVTEDSQWFQGFDEKYFRNQFWSARRILGTPMAFIYLLYWCFYRSKNFDIQLSKIQILKYSLIGFFEKR